MIIRGKRFDLFVFIGFVIPWLAVDFWDWHKELTTPGKLAFSILRDLNLAAFLARVATFVPDDPPKDAP